MIIFALIITISLSFYAMSTIYKLEGKQHDKDLITLMESVGE